jgi:hypothetical protein
MADYRHFSAFEDLCDRAEKTGLQVRLAASTDRVEFARRRGEEYRELERVELWPMRHAASCVESATIYNGDLEAAALDLLARAA